MCRELREPLDAPKVDAFYVETAKLRAPFSYQGTESKTPGFLRNISECVFLQ